MSLLAVDNPPNPWHATSVEYIGPPPTQRLEVYVDQTREILSRNQSPDIPFDFSVNPYRGCFHGCAYCYARPTHEFLGFGAGTDFERRIVVKPEAARLLAQAFERKSWKGERVMFSGNTDCYQPLEASYRLTRACLEVCLQYRNPVGLITKSPLIERDIDLLAALAKEAHVSVMISIPFADEGHARALEPTVPPPRRRFEAIRRLAEAGIPVGVNVAPIIPGLTDSQVGEILTRAREAGATYAGHILLRLPGPVAPVFVARLREALPDRADRVLARIEESHGGRLNDPRFGHRMRGEGTYADAIHQLFNQTAKRLGYGPAPTLPARSTFQRPGPAPDQLALF
jgi:DNA repair photolyase